MRDAFFVVRALNRIGATQTMEDFIGYILTIAAGRTETVRALYGIVPNDALEERFGEALKGFGGDGPVRIGNAAVGQNQHDVYGSIIMAATPMFFDRRLPRPGDAALFRLLEPLGEQAAKLATVPDAGIWEYRGRTRVHTHSAAMCWAGCQRLEAIAANLGLADRAHIGAPPQTGSARRCSRAPGIPSATRFPPPSAATISTPARCCSPISD